MHWQYFVKLMGNKLNRPLSIKLRPQNFLLKWFRFQTKFVEEIPVIYSFQYQVYLFQSPVVMTAPATIPSICCWFIFMEEAAHNNPDKNSRAIFSLSSFSVMESSDLRVIRYNVFHRLHYIKAALLGIVTQMAEGGERLFIRAQ